MWKTPRTLAIAGTALVSGLLVGAAVVPAIAAQDPVLTPDQQSELQAQIDAHTACLEEQGVTLPEKPADGTRPELTDEQREALHAAREACASTRPTKPELTDEQREQLRAQMDEHRECMVSELEAAGITLPERPARGAEQADGERPPHPQLTDEQQAAVQAAREACEELRPNLGVTGPGPFGRGFGPGHGHHGPGGPGLPGPDPADSPGGDTQAETTSV